VNEIERGQVRHRPLVAADEAFMWEIVYEAAHVFEEDGVGTAEMRSNPDLYRHVAGWGRSGDLGVVAEIDGVARGAAWLRLLVGTEREVAEYVDELIPELVIAVLPGHEGRGIGTALLTALLEAAFGMYPAIMLTARASNPAIRLYERLGFRETKSMTNRIGTQSVVMLLDMASPVRSEPSPM